MDTSAELTALTADIESDNLVPVVSCCAEERRSSDVGCSSSDTKLTENGEIMSDSISGNFVTDGNIDANFCMKSNVSGSSSSVSCEKGPDKSVEDKIITYCHAVGRRDNSDVDQVCGTNVTADGAKDDDTHADSRSQTPLQDELEPEVDELNQNQSATASNTELDPSMVVNPLHDISMKTKAECTEMPACSSTAEHNFREENGEVSDDDDAVGNQVNADSVSQQARDGVKLLKQEKLTKELESQKVFCLLFL